jgi:hypothetical protein
VGEWESVSGYNALPCNPGHAALLPILPLPGGAPTCLYRTGRTLPGAISRLNSEARIYSYTLVKNYNLMINIYLEYDK